MSDQAAQAPASAGDDATPFDRLIGETGVTTSAYGTAFTTAFRGYDKDEVDATIADLNARVRTANEQVELLKQNQRRAVAAVAHAREKAERLEGELAIANAQRREAAERLQSEVSAASEQGRGDVDRLEAELAAAQARAANAEAQVTALTEELSGASVESPNRQQFEEVLRVAEEQASVLIRNATIQGDRLLEAAREEIEKRRKEVRAEAEAILSHAESEAQQVRLRIETELTAHQARIERETAHAAEKVSQAEREAAAIRSEAEKGASALRSMVARETAHSRAEAEEAVRELRVRALEFEASLSRRQDDAQQEFLVLHNQAVAHAERITQDANDQVASSLEHAQRVAAKADDFERLMRAQAAQIEADAHLRAREQLDQARDKAQRIIDLVTSHSHAVLRDAEDRTRQLRWQQHQLTSFMAEVKELIRPEGPLAPRGAAEGDASEHATAALGAAEPGAVATEPGAVATDARAGAEPGADEPGAAEQLAEEAPVEVALAVEDIDAELAVLTGQIPVVDDGEAGSGGGTEEHAEAAEHHEHHGH